MNDILNLAKEYWWLILGVAAGIKFILEIMQFLETRRENRSKQTLREFAKPVSIIGLFLYAVDLFNRDDNRTNKKEPGDEI